MPESNSTVILPLLAALKPYADDIVLIGGWVPQLYRDYSGLQWNGKLSLTTEIDAVVDQSIEAGERPTLKEILTDAGLRPRPGTDGAIWEHIDDGSDAIELFTPLLGPIKGPPTRSLEQQAGVAAIALPDLELVTQFVNEISVPFGAGFVRVRVPTLGAYVATKALTFVTRPFTPGSQKRGKDIIYIHDIMRAGPEVIERVQQDLAAILDTARFTGNVRKAGNHLTLLRGHNPHPAFGDAVAILVEREGGTASIAAADILGSIDDLIELLA